MRLQLIHYKFIRHHINELSAEIATQLRSKYLNAKNITRERDSSTGYTSFELVVSFFYIVIHLLITCVAKTSLELFA